jgi:hypothetical protein
MTETLQNAIPPQHAKQYILAGKCTVGFHSLKTGNTFWYYVKQFSDKPGLWYVYLNYDVKEDDHKAGIIKTMPRHSGDISDKPMPTIYYAPNRPDLSPLMKEYVAAFGKAWEMILGDGHPQLVILHRGQCGYCGRPLTDQESLIRGIGPVCRKKLGI